ncbi:oligosaccharide flippase family protein [Geopseudomonas guangdongensis]|uniref:Membrane protein involved in the export of O-antigen and teichoic acid n=1 Tax=Geopseudomonas guangdongensis TaxID=1245526 RepID=A0A1H2E6T8_9GAMM|nr:oligosaccharide flippase family protein [Pseudomonas guangdongensis]SDT90841.1 Membrane protein involved in the export of O-antigen and teichoic acid [Pseudomonas guangdongensis]
MKPGMAVSTLKTAVGQFFGLLLGAVAVKLLAVLTGPAGVGLYSVLRHLQQMLSSVASIGGQNAVVQGLSSHQGVAKRQFFLSSFYVFVLASLLLSAAILIFADFIAAWIFAGEHASAIRWLVIPIVLGALLFFFRGVLTAEMQFGALSIVTMLTGLGAALVALPIGLVYARGYPNIMVLLLAGGPLLGLIAAFIFVRRQGYFQGLTAVAPSGATWNATVRFLRVALPSLLSLFLTLGSVLIVRSYIVRLYGLEGAGQFDAAWSISAMYLALFLTSLQSYLLPELSQVGAGDEMHSALAKAFHFSLLISLPLITCLVVMKPLIVFVLFSHEFLPSLNVLRWVLIGDFVRVLGWVISTALVARADMKGFALAEGLWSIIFMAMSLLLLSHGLEWVGFAYLVSYVFYLAFLTWRLLTCHGVALEGRRLLYWFGGIVMVALTAWLCWSDRELYSWHFILIFPALLFSFLIMRSDERLFARQLFERFKLRLASFSGRR